MKLLFDENLSRHLCQRLADLFPDSSHVALCQMLEVNDAEIWKYAKDRAFTVVTKDQDFLDLAIQRGHPPKVIRIGVGNCSTSQVESLLRWRAKDILAFADNPNVGILQLG